METENLAKIYVPEFVLQPNAISRAAHSMSANAQRLIMMAMAKLNLMAEGKDQYLVSFSVKEYLEALGLEYGGEQQKYILAAVRECMKNNIEIAMPNGEWESFTWFTYSKLGFEVTDKKTGKLKFNELPNEQKPDLWHVITMEFNYHLGEALKQFKKAYSKINLLDLGKIQSRYAIRYLELAMSYSGFAGQDGNKSGEWYLSYTFTELRKLFGISKFQYSRTGNFRMKIIDNPLGELNATGIGLHIEPEYIRQGRYLVGVQLLCRYVKREKPLPVLAEPVSETTQEDRFRAAFPEEYQALLEEEWKTSLPGWENNLEMQEIVHANRATGKLAELHPEFSQKEEAAAAVKKVGRPAKANAEKMLGYKKAHPEASLKEIGRLFQVSTATVSRALKQNAVDLGLMAMALLGMAMGTGMI
jgi:hypothetical protein